MRKSGVASLFGNKLVVGIAAGLAISLALSYAVMLLVTDDSADADSPDPERRLAAIEVLAERADDERAVEVLHRMSNDPVPRVARAATRAIGRGRRHERNRKALRTIIVEADCGAARGEAAAALGECEDVDPAVLTRMLAKDRDPMARAGAAKGLSRRRNRDDLPELLDALEDPDSRVRLWAITAIRKITALHFQYVAERPPSEQRKEIAKIRADVQRRSKRR